MVRSSSACEIQLLTPDGVPINTFDNRHIVRLFGLSSCFLSRSIRTQARSPFRLTLSFLPSFKLHEAAGVRITIAIGHKAQDPSDLHNAQSWWIGKGEIRKAHTFESMQRWDEEDSEVEPVRLEIPGYDWLTEEHIKEAMWQETGVTNKGCIAVFIQRGHLSDRAAYEDSSQPTFPPVSSYHTRETGAKVIRPSWFTPLSGIHGRPTIFEFRNLLRSSPDSESEDSDESDDSHSSADSSDDELRQAIAASVAEVGPRTQRSSSPPLGVKLEHEEEAFEKSVSYKRVKYTKPSTTTKQTKRPFSDCCYDEDDDQDDEEPLPIKKEPGTEDEPQSAPKKRKVSKVDEAELQRQIRESAAEALLAQAQLRQIEAERHLAAIRAANKAERERK